VQLFSWTGKWIAPNSPKINELTVEKDWLLITRSGSTGIVSIVPEAWEGYAMSEHIIRIVPDETKINPYYLLGFLRSEYCQEIINKGVFGSVLDEIDPSFIGKIQMPVPVSDKEFNQIIEPIKKAEQARNEAILMTETSLKNLNIKLTEEFSTA
jgi:restriction endonuclease S subunit